jgi:hypothetical protein
LSYRHSGGGGGGKQSSTIPALPAASDPAYNTPDLTKPALTSLFNNIKKAYAGRAIWLDIVKKYNLSEKDYVILMPSLSREYNYYGLLYFDQFMKHAKADRGIILTSDERVVKTASLFSENIADVVEFSQKKAELLMKFYCLYMFTDKLVIISLEEPEGRSGLQLVGKKNMTLEEIMAIGVYGLKEFIPANVPVYAGDDANIHSFLGNPRNQEVMRHAM